MTEQYIVVDENDTIVGYKERREDIHPTKEYYRITGLRLTNSQGDIFIAQRAWNKRLDPGKRCPAVSWTVEKWESYEQNMIKEMEEEIGLTGVPLTLWPKYKRTWDCPNHFTQMFFAKVDKDISEFTIEEWSVEAVKWISKDELKKDIAAHPDHYITSMKKRVEEF